jgi:hypothetical protein
MNLRQRLKEEEKYLKLAEIKGEVSGHPDHWAYEGFV